MSLQQKILKLRMDAVIAARHAAFWQKAISEHGEAKATAFYSHLGLNHLEKKSFEWEGLTLSREPKEHEKIAIKGIAQAQESSKEQLIKLLSKLRLNLIESGLEGISELSPGNYHTLTLSTPAEFRPDLRDRLIKVYRQGRSLVAVELGKEEKQGIEDEFDNLDDLVDLTGSRIVNDVQSRITAAAARYRTVGLTAIQLLSAIQTEVADGSVSYIDRAATGLANRVISIGRGDEARDRRDEWDRVEYSAILDQNVCNPCAVEDGKTASDEDDLQPAPNPDCAGGDWCRCFHVWINQ